MEISVIGARGIPDVEGGAEKNAEMIFPIIARKHEVRLFSVHGYSWHKNYKGIEIIDTPNFRLFGTDKLGCYIYACLHSFRRKPDIIHCQGLGAAIFLLFYKLAARRVIVRYGSIDYKVMKWSWIGRLGFRLSEWQLRFADCVIAVAPSLKQELESRGNRVRVIVIPNAIDPENSALGEVDSVLERHKLERGEYVLGVGRITPQKDFRTLIRAFHLVRRQSANKFVKLVIVGGDDRSGYFEELLKEADDQIYFAGRLPRREVRALLEGCGVYVNSSVHEGMSNAVLEAISARCPILLSDIIENRDLPLERHQFFPTGDAEKLAEKIERVCIMPKQFVAPLDAFLTWKEVAEKTLEIYESLFQKQR